MARKTDIEKVNKSLSKKPTVNKNATVKTNKTTEIYKPQKIFKCTCCGYEYKVQNENFSKSRSPLYSSNNGYITVCKSCVRQVYEQLVDVFSGNEEQAVERICQIFDLYLGDEPLAYSLKEVMGKSRIDIYMSKLNLRQVVAKGTTYLDTIKQRHTLSTLDSVNSTVREDQIDVLDEEKEFWGDDYLPSDYKILNNHYKTFASYPEIENDPVKLNLVKELCNIYLQQRKALKSENIDLYDKLVKTYQSTLSNANFKPLDNNKPETTLDPLGCWVRDIERYSPAEFFKKQKLYEDSDGIKSYFERFVYRPLKNLFLHTKEMDSEYSIPDDEVDGG